jgi:hypothetical protein
MGNGNQSPTISGSKRRWLYSLTDQKWLSWAFEIKKIRRIKTAMIVLLFEVKENEKCINNYGCLLSSDQNKSIKF